MSSDGFGAGEMAIEAKPLPEEEVRIRYLYCYSAVFANPNWFMNLLLGGVCLMIPMVGPIVAMGYLYEVVEWLHRRRGSMYPDFDFDRFVPYLSRGVWPWLVSFIVSIIIQFIQFPLMVLLQVAVFSIAGLAQADEAAGIITAMIVVPLLVIVFFAFFLMLNLIMMPMMLRAGLSQDFGQSFQFKWIRDFIRRVWLEMILAQLFLGVTVVIVLMAGFALLCLGVIPAVMLWYLASSFLNWQLYELYLARGGEPIPLKVDPKALPPVRAPGY